MTDEATVLKELSDIEAKHGADAEAEHACVDRLMLDLLREHGYAVFVARVEKLQEGWWWA